MTELVVEKRDVKKSPSSVRASGSIPAVYYGKKVDSTAVSVSKKDFEKVLKEAGESSVITLKDGKASHDVLIHDVQVHPVTDELRHVDFYVVEKDKLVKVAVPIEFIGEAPAIKTLGGVLVKALHEIEVEAFPRNLPQSIEVDVSGLDDFEKSITIAQIKFGEGVTPTLDATEVVVLVNAPKEEEEEAPVEEVDLSAIEVEKKGKDGDEAEGGASAEGKETEK